MRIGELADRVGVKPATVRYYETIGLLPAPQRTAAGYRDYDPTTTRPWWPEFRYESDSTVYELGDRFGIERRTADGQQHPPPARSARLVHGVGIVQRSSSMVSDMYL